MDSVWGEIRAHGDAVVRKYADGEGATVFVAYERAALTGGTHVAVTTFEDLGAEGWWGRINKRRGPSAFPSGAWASYEAWRAGVEADCYAAILAAFPEAAAGVRSGGEVKVRRAAAPTA